MKWQMEKHWRNEMIEWQLKRELEMKNEWWQSKWCRMAIKMRNRNVIRNDKAIEMTLELVTNEKVFLKFVCICAKRW
jgi:hypothetical protein